LGEISVTLLFVFGWSLSRFLIDLPFTIYWTFVLEEEHGFNKQVQTLGWVRLCRVGLGWVGRKWDGMGWVMIGWTELGWVMLE
jgi:hypothetical protein